MNFGGYIFEQTWPKYDEAKTIDSEVEMPIQINGKVRTTLMIPKDAKFDKSKYSSILEEYVEIEADDNKKYVPKDFDYKKGILDGYISIDYGYDTVKNKLTEDTGDLEILTDVFTGIVKSRIRIYSNEEREKRKKNNEEDDEMSSLFKREYKIFNPKIKRINDEPVNRKLK